MRDPDFTLSAGPVMASPRVLAALGSPIEPQFGAIPDASLVPVTLPDVLVFDRVAEVWHKVKKHAVIALVFDNHINLSLAR